MMSRFCRYIDKCFQFRQLPPLPRLATEAADPRRGLEAQERAPWCEQLARARAP
jgi:hypothetical protein